MKPTKYNRNAYPRIQKPADYACAGCGKDAECFLGHGGYAKGEYTAYCRPCKAEHEPRPTYFR